MNKRGLSKKKLLKLNNEVTKLYELVDFVSLGGESLSFEEGGKEYGLKHIIWYVPHEVAKKVGEGLIKILERYCNVRYDDISEIGCGYMQYRVEGGLIVSDKGELIRLSHVNAVSIINDNQIKICDSLSAHTLELGNILQAQWLFAEIKKYFTTINKKENGNKNFRVKRSGVR